MRMYSAAHGFVAIGLFTTALVGFSVAQNASEVRAKVREFRESHEGKILQNFSQLLAIPNLASDSPNIRKNAKYISALLSKRGVRTRLLETPGAPPVVYGELPASGARHTLVIYAHYDGQPVDESQWTSPPWAPIIRDKALDQGGKEVSLESLPGKGSGEYRIFARSAGDDKAPIQAVLTALDSLESASWHPNVNLKFFFEGEEEAGSPHLPTIIAQNADLLRADAWLLCDGPVHQSRQMQVYFGARGITEVELTVYGPVRPLHSGHYGNWAPNPAALISELLSSMRDHDANIKIPGYYQDVRPLTDSERLAIRQMPEVDGALKNELGLAWTEGEPEPLPLRIMKPALNVRGIEAGHVGTKTQNAVPSEARASIDFRLVPDQQPEKIPQLVEDHIRAQGFFIVHEDPTIKERRAHRWAVKLQWGTGYPAARTSMDLPVSRAVVSSIEEALGGAIIRAPMLGGSVPMYLFTDGLHTPVIGVPIANHDNNQHAADENLRIQNLWDGIEVFAGVMMGVEGHWK
jgi:acetylornithine deacetylase/succinyl-diaminopimelate desuccinylase-like protein